MSTLLEVKEQMSVVSSVGDFANALQQIAAMRMNMNRKKVLAGRRFVTEAEKMLRELKAIKAIQDENDISDIERHAKHAFVSRISDEEKAVIVMTSDQGLNGSFNQDIFKKVQEVVANKDDLYPGFKDANYYILGKKGQEYFRLGKIKVKYYPYLLPENFEISHMRRLIKIFRFYTNILLVYPKYVNTKTHEIKVMSLVTPPERSINDTNIYKDKKTGKDSRKEMKEEKNDKQQQVGYINTDIKYIFEPKLDEIITKATETLRTAVLRQEILDTRLSHYSAQMVGMKAASDNAIELNKDLRKEYNKQRRKLIDKKISEVFAGLGVW